jgi:hypothetical protein
MGAFSKAILAYTMLFLTTLVHAYPQASEHRLENAHVLIDAGSYMPGDDVTNHGGITFSSNGLGTWHAGLRSSMDVERDSIENPESDRDFDSLLASETKLLSNIATLSDPNDVSTRAISFAQVIPEPASWLLLLPLIPFLFWRASIRTPR